MTKGELFGPGEINGRDTNRRAIGIPASPPLIGGPFSGQLGESRFVLPSASAGPPDGPGIPHQPSDKRPTTDAVSGAQQPKTTGQLARPTAHFSVSEREEKAKEPLTMEEIPPSFWNLNPTLNLIRTSDREMLGSYTQVPHRLQKHRSANFTVGADTHEGEQVVLKIGLSSDPIAHEVSKREALLNQRAASVTQNVPRFLEQGELSLDNSSNTRKESFPFIALEYIPGPTFMESTWEALGVTETLDQLVPVAEAVDAIGEEGIIHRDINPDNLLKGPDGTCVLIDFGIAITSGKKTTIPMRGLYQAPELVTIGSELTPATNVWQFTANTFRGITGKDLMGLHRERKDMDSLLRTGNYSDYMHRQLRDTELTGSQQDLFVLALAEDHRVRPTAMQFMEELSRTHS